MKEAEAALYQRPNLRLAPRPGRLGVQGREDRYQPLPQPPLTLDTTRYIDSLSLNQQTPTHTMNIFQTTHIQIFVIFFSLDIHATSLPCSGEFLPCPGSIYPSSKNLQDKKRGSSSSDSLNVHDPTDPRVDIAAKTAKEDIITLMLHCLSLNTLSLLRF